MLSRAISNLCFLFYIVSLWITLNFDGASCRIDFASIDVKKFLKRSNSSLNDSINIVPKKTRLVDGTFIFPNITLSNISIQSLNVNGQIFNYHTGYYPIQHSHDARMFYFFSKSRGCKSDPIILWLAGGPGLGSLEELFHGLGPLRINHDLSLKWNDFGWDKVSNLLFVDQPTNTGFSFSSDDRDIRHNTNEVSNDLYDFLKAFFQDHPELLKNDFYIAGTSYAGHTIPVLASRLIKENKAKRGIHVNLKGLAIGNGLINPEYTYSSYHDVALANKLISKSSYNKLKKLNVECIKSIQLCQIDDKGCEDSYQICRHNFKILTNIIVNINPYDIRRKLTEDQSDQNVLRLSKFLDQDHVKKALKVGSIGYIYFNADVFDAMANDFVKNYATNIPSLLENGIKILIYDGEYDLMCNWLGNLRFLDSMQWSGRSHFLKSQLTSYKIDGKKVGQVKRTGALSYMKVHNAGHNVFSDQPNVALQMLKNWIDA